MARSNMIYACSVAGFDHVTLPVGGGSVSEQTSLPPLGQDDDEGLVFNFEGSPSASQYESIFDPRQSRRHTVQMVRPIIIHGSVGGMAVGDHNAVHVGNNSVQNKPHHHFLSKMMMEVLSLLLKEVNLPASMFIHIHHQK
ncbi:uncharacterized protein [Ptychodera flava]|uniref:uncharacterized protein isoform X2 n=1 Tax=Ptychodera flava TaxID=63121 RepID=UPI00396A8296